MYTIRDEEMDAQLALPLILRPAAAEPARQQRPDKCAPSPDEPRFPWQVPLPDEAQWQQFLCDFLDELRDNPTAVQSVLSALARLRGKSRPE